MTDPILIDFGDNNPGEAPDREHRLVPEPPPITRRRDIEDVKTRENLL